MENRSSIQKVAHVSISHTTAASRETQEKEKDEVDAFERTVGLSGQIDFELSVSWAEVRPDHFISLKCTLSLCVTILSASFPLYSEHTQCHRTAGAKKF